MHRTDSLIKRSNVIGADESAGSGQRILLPYPDYPEFDISQDDSAAIGGHSSSSSRSHSLASRLRSSRLLGSGMLKPGRRGGVGDEVVGSTNSLALLGPSRQLAGVVASMSTLPSDAGTSPSSAAALASAVAVAGATGSWQQPRSLAAADQISSQTGVETPGSNVTVKTTNRPRELIHETDPPVRYVPPAASVAAGECMVLAVISLTTQVAHLSVFSVNPFLLKPNTTPVKSRGFVCQIKAKLYDLTVLVLKGVVVSCRVANEKVMGSRSYCLLTDWFPSLTTLDHFRGKSDGRKTSIGFIVCSDKLGVDDDELNETARPTLTITLEGNDKINLVF